MQYQAMSGAQRRLRHQRVLVVEQHQVVRLLQYARDVDGYRLVQLQGVGGTLEIVVGQKKLVDRREQFNRSL